MTRRTDWAAEDREGFAEEGGAGREGDFLLGVYGFLFFIILNISRKTNRVSRAFIHSWIRNSRLKNSDGILGHLRNIPARLKTFTQNPFICGMQPWLIPRLTSASAPLRSSSANRTRARDASAGPSREMLRRLPMPWASSLQNFSMESRKEHGRLVPRLCTSRKRRSTRNYSNGRTW